MQARRVTEHTDRASKRIADTRAPHNLNDAAVQIRDGATGAPVYRGGASLVGGHGHIGYVWAVADGRAVVDFGISDGGHGLRVVVAVGDLVAAS